MKCLLLIVVVGFATVVLGFATGQNTKSKEDIWLKAIKDCAVERNVTIDQITKTQAGDFSEADLNRLNCFTECFYGKIRFIRQGSVSIEKENMRTYVLEHNGEQYMPILDSCLTSSGHNLCELSYNVYKCFTTKALKKGLVAQTPAPESLTKVPETMSNPAPPKKEAQPAQQTESPEPAKQTESSEPANPTETPQPSQQTPSTQLPVPDQPIALQLQPAKAEEEKPKPAEEAEVKDPKPKEPETSPQDTTAAPQDKEQAQPVVPLKAEVQQVPKKNSES